MTIRSRPSTPEFRVNFDATFGVRVPGVLSAHVEPGGDRSGNGRSPALSPTSPVPPAAQAGDREGERGTTANSRPDGRGSAHPLPSPEVP